MCDLFLAKLLGLVVTYGDNRCVVSFNCADFLFNPQGTLHGGIIATVLDISMGHLLKHEEGPGATLEMKVQYVKGARAGPLTCTGEFIRKGKKISFLKSTLTGNDGDVIAFATSTWKLLGPPSVVPTGDKNET